MTPRRVKARAWIWRTGTEKVLGALITVGHKALFVPHNQLYQLGDQLADLAEQLENTGPDHQEQENTP